MCPTDITILAEGNAVHVIGDLQGYFHKFPTERVKSFVLTSNFSEVNVSIVGGCSNDGGASITVVAPADGRFLVEATAIVRLNHSEGTTSHVTAHIGT